MIRAEAKALQHTRSTHPLPNACTLLIEPKWAVLFGLDDNPLDTVTSIVAVIAMKMRQNMLRGAASLACRNCTRKSRQPAFHTCTCPLGGPQRGGFRKVAVRGAS